MLGLEDKMESVLGDAKKGISNISEYVAKLHPLIQSAIVIVDVVKEKIKVYDDTESATMRTARRFHDTLIGGQYPKELEIIEADGKTYPKYRFDDEKISLDENLLGNNHIMQQCKAVVIRLVEYFNNHNTWIGFRNNSRPAKQIFMLLMKIFYGFSNADLKNSLVNTQIEKYIEFVKNLRNTDELRGRLTESKASNAEIVLSHVYEQLIDIQSSIAQIQKEITVKDLLDLLTASLRNICIQGFDVFIRIAASDEIKATDGYLNIIAEDLSDNLKNEYISYKKDSLSVSAYHRLIFDLFVQLKKLLGSNQKGLTKFKFEPGIESKLKESKDIYKLFNKDDVFIKNYCQLAKQLIHLAQIYQFVGLAKQIAGPIGDLNYFLILGGTSRALICQIEAVHFAFSETIESLLKKMESCANDLARKSISDVWKKNYKNISGDHKVTLNCFKENIKDLYSKLRTVDVSFSKQTQEKIKELKDQCKSFYTDVKSFNEALIEEAYKIPQIEDDFNKIEDDFTNMMLATMSRVPLNTLEVKSSNQSALSLNQSTLSSSINHEHKNTNNDSGKFFTFLLDQESHDLIESYYDKYKGTIPDIDNHIKTFIYHENRLFFDIEKHKEEKSFSNCFDKFYLHHYLKIDHSIKIYKETNKKNKKTNEVISLLDITYCLRTELAYRLLRALQKALIFGLIEFKDAKEHIKKITLKFKESVNEDEIGKFYLGESKDKFRSMYKKTIDYWERNLTLWSKLNEFEKIINERKGLDDIENIGLGNAKDSKIDINESPSPIPRSILLNDNTSNSLPHNIQKITNPAVIGHQSEEAAVQAEASINSSIVSITVVSENHSQTESIKRKDSEDKIPADEKNEELDYKSGDDLFHYETILCQAGVTNVGIHRINTQLMREQLTSLRISRGRIEEFCAQTEVSNRILGKIFNNFSWYNVKLLTKSIVNNQEALLKGDIYVNVDENANTVQFYALGMRKIESFPSTALTSENLDNNNIFQFKKQILEIVVRMERAKAESKSQYIPAVVDGLPTIKDTNTNETINYNRLYGFSCRSAFFNKDIKSIRSNQAAINRLSELILKCNRWGGLDKLSLLGGSIRAETIYGSLLNVLSKPFVAAPSKPYPSILDKAKFKESTFKQATIAATKVIEEIDDNNSNKLLRIK